MTKPIGDLSYWTLMRHFYSFAGNTIRINKVFPIDTEQFLETRELQYERQIQR